MRQLTLLLEPIAPTREAAPPASGTAAPERVIAACDDLTIPDFLDRKKHPIEPATLEERQAYAPEPFVEIAKRNELEELNREDRRQKALERIARMKRRQALKAGVDRSWRNIPVEHLAWDDKRCRFYDVRVKT